MSHNIIGLLTDPFTSAVSRFGSQIPAFAAAFLLLLLGMFLARGLRTLLETLFGRVRVDEHTSKIGINEVLARLGLGQSPTYVLSFVVYWSILFIFIVAAADAVNMTVVSDLLERFVVFLPVLVSALLILFGGLLFARLLHQVVANAASANNIRGGSLLAHAAYALVLIFSTIAALEQLGIKGDYILGTFQILLGSAGLAAAIALGLGGKDLAAEALRDLFGRKAG